MTDSTAELLEMDDRIGVERRWLQNAGTYREHFDVCHVKRKLTIAAGAVAVTQRDLALLLRRRRPVGGE